MLDRYRNFRAERLTFAALALVLAMTGCKRRDEGASEPAPKPLASAAVAGSEPQPDFIKHPPIHQKPPCGSSSGTAANDGGNRCITLTLRCAELDPGEPVWLATTPPIAKVRLPEGVKGLRVTAEDEVSATVCCKAAAAERGPGKAQLRLFTDDVAGSTHELECP